MSLDWYTVLSGRPRATNCSVNSGFTDNGLRASVARIRSAVELQRYDYSRVHLVLILDIINEPINFIVSRCVLS